MVSFAIGVALLILGYFLYSKLINKVLGVDPGRKTPAVEHPDGVDYVPMKPWRVFLIQFLNIAGVGPIIGAIMGAQFGTASYLWIVFGCIFAGAVHDFVSGFVSIRMDGASLPEIHGRFLGNGMKQFMRGFTVFLMILVGAVFVFTPAALLNQFNDNVNALCVGAFGFDPGVNNWTWIALIFLYYMLATMLPIDKIIGRFYPIFGMLLLGMAAAIVVAFIVYHPAIPEVWDGLGNRHPQASTNPVFPMMFISIACGAISGFHATQSPLMARCMVNEKQSRAIFYGAMITEGVVGLIWAAAANYFFHEHAAEVLGKSGPQMVGFIANSWFTPAIAFICILGVISAAVTSGDTALRSARLIVADFMHIDQKPVGKRFLVALPVFVLSAALTVWAVLDNNGFQNIYRYFAWANQVLAMVTLWACTVFLAGYRKDMWYLITLLPALFMTMVTMSFILVSQQAGLGLVMPQWLGYSLAGVITVAFYVLFAIWQAKNRKTTPVDAIKK